MLDIVDFAVDSQHHIWLDKLVYMANQIGKFFAAQGPSAAVSGTCDHLKKYWEPRMRAAIIAHLDAGGDGLDPMVKKAIIKLKQTTENK